MLLPLLALLACSQSSAGPPGKEGGRPASQPRPQVVVYPATGARPVTVEVEVARTPEEHARGLMFRRELPEGRGMLFLFPRAEVRRFWMKNTLIPLDILFLDEKLRVVSIEENTAPHDETGRGPDEPVQYVLEVPAGYARRHGIGPGARAALVNLK
ncbi:MAG: DUF192 domain-containing protein [Myxococcales bacterium]|nr:DUF192 domain-containing protein [Myxococcota bacterium]MDW8281688.1 DUF192 domain-containing protein [Myxococcales bacterium]